MWKPNQADQPPKHNTSLWVRVGAVAATAVAVAVAGCSSGGPNAPATVSAAPAAPATPETPSSAPASTANTRTLPPANVYPYPLPDDQLKQPNAFWAQVRRLRAAATACVHIPASQFTAPPKWVLEDDRKTPSGVIITYRDRVNGQTDSCESDWVKTADGMNHYSGTTTVAGRAIPGQPPTATAALNYAADQTNNRYTTPDQFNVQTSPQPSVSAKEWSQGPIIGPSTTVSPVQAASIEGVWAMIESTIARASAA